LAAAGLVLAGCGDTPPEDEADDAALQVVTAFYPLHFLAERVGGELVSAEDLTPPGADPHDLEIAPATVAVMEQSDVVVYLTGFQPAVDAGVEQISGPVTLDLAEVVDLRDTSGTVHT